jgi:predicted NUDIX family NTP pyrophosphohydrolase
MIRKSAGILPFRRQAGDLEVLLVHPGGPFWAKKDLAAWSIAKGECEAGEEAFGAALREFEEETGFRPAGEFLRLGERKQPSGKLVEAWAVETDWDPAQLRSSTCEIEWPRGSGRRLEIPEVDRAAWFAMPEATRRILPGQLGFLAELHEKLTGRPLSPPG